MRLDIYLFETGRAKSRTEAARLIKDGFVTFNGKICKTPATSVTCDDEISVDTSECRYVSRGGLKLEAALLSFGVTPCGEVALDIGASTGGFTDCLLQFGAKKVFALENGHGQLAPSLAQNDKVVNMEHFNAREMKREDFSLPISFVTMDVSFISQTLILPSIAEVLCDGGTLITLIKPQFEVGKSGLSKGGIVRDEQLRKKAVNAVCDFAVRCGFILKGCIESPIRGGDGNVEYLAYFTREEVK
jgi:23S rRNA (cytidine1920-2'-O)/16S rRNA (cytidine1409-2'-O)-methyltransferase